MKLLIIFMLLLSLCVYGKREPSSNLEAQVILYLMDNGKSEDDAYKETRGGGAFVGTDKQGTRIIRWSVQGIEEPNPYELPPVDESKQILGTKSEYREFVNGKWKMKSEDDIQAQKPEQIKRIENDIMQFFWDEGIISTEKKYLTPQHWDAMWTYLETEPDNKFNKLNKNITLLEKKGGDVNDVYWHDDV